LIEHWNGLGWSVVPAPSPNSGVLFGIDARSSYDVWAVGSFSGGGKNLPLVEHWDGTGWTIIDAAPSHTGFGHDVAVAGGRVWLVGDNGTQGRSVIEELCPAQILDSGFSPKAESVALGRTATWSIPGSDATSHSVTDGTGLGLFDSGLRAPGGSFAYTFANAGNYSIVDAGSSNRETVKVAPTASPKSGSPSTIFTVTWATAPLPSGRVADVQLKRPNGVFVDWLTDQTAPSATFTPDSGTGTYSFRARLRDTNTGARTAWSPGALIRVR
jgi:plastocyanin